MDDLTRFVTAKISEDEKIARRNIGMAQAGKTARMTRKKAARTGPITRPFDGDEITAASACLDRFRPLRMLRKGEAKRKLIERHGGRHLASHGLTAA